MNTTGSSTPSEGAPPTAAALASKLADAGATSEMIAIALEAMQAAVEAARAPRERSSAAVRQARYRERMASQGVTRDVTRDVTERNESVTDPSPSPFPPVPPSHTLPPITPQTTPPSQETKRVRGSRLPEGWKPNIAGRALAVELLGSNSAAHAELEKFSDHWRSKAGRDGVKLDWDATWRNWVRKAAEYDGRSRASPAPPRPLSYVESLKRNVSPEQDLADPKFDFDLTATDVTPTP